MTLESAIIAEPDNDEAWAVYADELLSQGDPRGELIALERALRENPHDDSLKIALQELRDQHDAVWFGTLLEDEHHSIYDFAYPELLLECYNGFIRVLEMGVDSGQSPDPIPGYLQEAFASPLGGFMRQLILNIPFIENQDKFQSTFEKIVQSFTDAKRLPPLSKLELRLEVAEVEDGIVPLFVEHIHGLFPHLPELTLTGAVINPGQFQLPELRVLKMEKVPTFAMQGFCESEFPALVALKIQLASQRDPDPQGEIDNLQGFFNNQSFKSLEHLLITNCMFTNRLLRETEQAPWLPGLKSLDLPFCHMDESSAELLLRNADSFLHLESLKLGFVDPGDTGQRLEEVFGDRLKRRSPWRFH